MLKHFFLKIIVNLTYVFILIAGSVKCQIIYNPNDERFKELALEKAIWVYLEKKEEHGRIQALGGSQFISKSEQTSVEVRFRLAELELKQALLAWSQDAPHLDLQGVWRTYDAEGEVKLTLKIRNNSVLSLANIGDSLVNVLARELLYSDILFLSNLSISVLDSGVIVGYPYEKRISQLAPGEEAEVTFTLLRNIEVIEVLSKYNGVVDRRRVIPNDRSLDSKLSVHATPLFQEAFLGSRVTYVLTFYRGGSSKRALGLATSGLPSDCNWVFRDVVSGAQVSKLDFSSQVTTQRVQLEISLPKRATRLTVPDTNLSFRVEVLDEDSSSTIAFQMLELRPRGLGILSTSTENWLVRTSAASALSLSVQVSNDGSSGISDVSLDFEAPPGWKVSVSNLLELKIAPEESMELLIDVVPPVNVLPGDYEMTMEANGQSGNLPVNSDKKVFRIMVENEARFMQYLVLLGGMATIVGISILLTRRLKSR